MDSSNAGTIDIDIDNGVNSVLVEIMEVTLGLYLNSCEILRLL